MKKFDIKTAQAWLMVAAALFLAALPADAAQTSTITLKVDSTLTGTTELTTPTDTLNYAKKLNLLNGTGANKAESIWRDQRTLAASGTESLDINAQTDAFGATVAFTKLKAMIVCAASGNTNNVLVGGAATNALVNWVSDATDTIVVAPGACFMLTNPSSGGFGVTAGTGDLLKITNSGGGTGVTYDIIVIGETT